MTHQQRKMFFAYLKELGITDQRKDLVHQYTEGRTDSTKEMTQDEVYLMLQDLLIQIHPPKAKDQKQYVNKMRSKVVAIAVKIGMLKLEKNYEDTDWGFFNNWMLQYGYLHKPLMKYKMNELPKLVSQLEVMEKNIGKAKFSDYLEGVLAEQNISVET
ncbi:hypothetical protein MY04_4778 [Flammeovirga sp. MY04]|uniref:hypothetical protein n=1 Tax=Flammeovirga sp. MY04 TaxID=1191459 RepID=UPI0008241D14|nr:hypothetical protein [Flammeovirga sp. MY04]ANQ49595.2 hypothetical protein MY04_2221 [Flammeovirga sp. MY04]ANQ52113.2 hypothetical protein MY04_4778 [Flammeovirga sp. MY04]